LPQGASAESLMEMPSPQSVLEKVSKSTLLEELQKIDVSVEDKYIGLENIDDGVIHVRLALLGKGTDAIFFSFDVSQKISLVTNLKVNTVSGEVPVNDEFALRDLPIKVQQIFKQAMFEKQKEDEMKKMLREGNPAK
ncbi:MAG: hypothetical protein AAB606_03650, partial [Patescibacteria group bacterium]